MSTETRTAGGLIASTACFSQIPTAPSLRQPWATTTEATPALALGLARGCGPQGLCQGSQLPESLEAEPSPQLLEQNSHQISYETRNGVLDHSQALIFLQLMNIATIQLLCQQPCHPLCPPTQLCPQHSSPRFACRQLPVRHDLLHRLAPQDSWWFAGCAIETELFSCLF